MGAPGSKRVSFGVCLAGLLVTAARSVALAATLAVPAGGDLQAALDAAKPGDVVTLAAGAVYSGNFVLGNKGAQGPAIVVRGSTDDGQLPAAGVRMAPAYAALLPKLRSPNSEPALRTAAAATGWTLRFLEFQSNAGGYGDIIRLGAGDSTQSSLAQVPAALVLDRLYVHGDPTVGQKRCIALNSADTAIVSSYVSDCKAVGQDSQAIGGWNGPGPFLIENNYLEGAGENVMFGGSDPSIPGLVPSNITVRGNYVSKPLTWRAQAWSVKNLFELKNAQDVLVEGNVFENIWVGGQSGYAVQLTPRNQDGTAPWSVVQRVVVRDNVIRHAAGGVNILGTDNEHPSQTANHVTISNNVFDDLTGATWGYGSRPFQIGDGADTVTIAHNTVVTTDSAIVMIYGGTAASPTPVPRFSYTNNLAPHDDYGIFGDNFSSGKAALTAYAPDGVVVRNVLAGGNAWQYPPDNFFPPVAAWQAGFVDFAGGDYHLAAGSPYKGAASDGTDIGADIDRVGMRTAQVVGGNAVSGPRAPGGLRVVSQP